MSQDAGGFDPAALASIQGSTPVTSWPPPSQGIGGNNPPADALGTNLTQDAQQKLRNVVAQIERLNDEEREIKAARKEVYDGAKSMGFDQKTIRKVISLRKQDRQKREEEEALLDVYMVALGEAEAFDARD